MSDETRRDEDLEGDLATQQKPKTRKPRLFKVLLHNDDYTTMEFVIWVLVSIFNKSETEATQIMLHVHTKGVGVCGLYTYDVAETKVAEVTNAAREHGHPLKCTMEPE
jgi:ATP-dependent Clp protease adaptor protein ClpS